MIQHGFEIARKISVSELDKAIVRIIIIIIKKN